MGIFDNFIGGKKPSLNESIKKLADLYKGNTIAFYKIILKEVQSNFPEYFLRFKNCGDNNLANFLVVCQAAQLMDTARFVFRKKYINNREEMDLIFNFSTPLDILPSVSEYFNKYQAISPDRPEVMASKFGTDAVIALIDADNVALAFFLGFLYTSHFIGRTHWCVANAFGDKQTMKELEYSLSLL